MRLSLTLLAFPVACSVCADGCLPANPCHDLPAVTSACGSFVLEGQEEPVCGCPVSVPETPVCSLPDPRAPISLSWWEVDDPETYQLGAWPDLRSLAEGACPTVEELVALGQSAEPTGSLPIPVEGNKERDWVELTFSPDGAMVGLYERLAPGYVQAGSVARCAEGEEPGWVVERFLETVTSPFLRWGVASGDTRQVYLMMDDFWRVTLRAEPQLGRPPLGGEERELMVIEDIELLARSEAGSLAFGDLDVSFDLDELGAPRDRYAVYMSGIDASYFPLYVEAAIYLTDLTDCAAECTDDMRFCCRTLFLDQGDSDYPDIPTNPGLSDDGALVAFNRFTSTKEQCPDWALCAQEHVLKNPFEHPELMEAHCVEDAEHDGFHDAMDCSDLLTTGGRFDDDKCPDHRCCDDDGVDCSRCITIGEQPEVANACASEGEGVRERNYVVFFELEGATWVGFRSAGLLGDLSEELHAYRVGFDEQGDFAPQGEDGAFQLLLTGGDELPMADFGPGPWRRLPGELACGGGE
jgi:hypothetical protein